MEDEVKVEHNIFDIFFYPAFLEHYKRLRAKNNGVIIVIVDHKVYDDFFWDLNEVLINSLKKEYKLMGSKWNPIIPLPLNSTEEEFGTIMTKMMNGGTLLMDSNTFFTMTFKSKNPIYFYCDRILIHRTGDISVLAGRKF